MTDNGRRRQLSGTAPCTSLLRTIKVLALDASNGKLLWQTPYNPKYGLLYASTLTDTLGALRCTKCLIDAGGRSLPD
jgi:hypothetical protein